MTEIVGTIPALVHRGRHPIGAILRSSPLILTFETVGNARFTIGVDIRCIIDGVEQSGYRRHRCIIDENGDVVWIAGSSNRTPSSLWDHRSYGEAIDNQMLSLAYDLVSTDAGSWFWLVRSAALMELERLKQTNVTSGDRLEMLRRVDEAFHRWAGQSKRQHTPLEFYKNAVAGGEPLPPEPDFDGVL